MKLPHFLVLAVLTVVLLGAPGKLKRSDLGKRFELYDFSTFHQWLKHLRTTARRILGK
jgi:hypothetical protein